VISAVKQRPVRRRKLKARNTIFALSAGLRSQENSREKADHRNAKPCFCRRQDKSKNVKMKSRSHCPENHLKYGVRDTGRTSCNRESGQSERDSETFNAEIYRLMLGLFVSYIQRRQFSGKTPLLPNKPANMPNRMAVPTTKMQAYPIHNEGNIITSKSGSPGVLEARTKV
jgi:hypothetical protein